MTIRFIIWSGKEIEHVMEVGIELTKAGKFDALTQWIIMRALREGEQEGRKIEIVFVKEEEYNHGR